MYHSCSENIHGKVEIIQKKIGGNATFKSSHRLRVTQISTNPANFYEVFNQ